MDDLQIDTSDLKRLAASIDRTVDIAPVRVRAVVQKGAFNIKKDAQRRSSGIAHAPNYPYTITYDTFEMLTQVGAEIGPDKNKQVGGGPYRTPGNLGAIFEYGLPGTAPIPHLGPALEAEAPRFEQALEDAIVEAVLGW